MKLTICLPLLALLHALPAHAQQFEDLSALDAKIAPAVAVGSVKPIDRRLKLARCPDPIIFDTAAASAIVLRCHPLGWRIRVPITQDAGRSGSSELLVKRGEMVQLVIQGDDFEIASSGIAIDDGFSGKRIRVKSLTGAGSITGTVAGQGLVHIED